MAETPNAKCCWPASLRNHPHNSICWRSAVECVCRNLLWHFLNLLSDLTPPEQRNRGVAKTSFVISWRKSLHKNCPTLEICMKKEGSKGAPIHLIRISRPGGEGGSCHFANWGGISAKKYIYFTATQQQGHLVFSPICFTLIPLLQWHH